MSEKGEAPTGKAGKSLATNAAHSAGELGNLGARRDGAQAALCTPWPDMGRQPSTFTFGVVETPKIHSAGA
jgi:hypothetical protein